MFFISILPGCSGTSSQQQDTAAHSRLLSVEAYRDAVYASWIGQIVGNPYGLCYEFEYIEEPRPDDFPYGYTWTLDRLQVTPEMNLENSQWLNPTLMNHHITFAPVVTSGIRIVGEAGGIPGSEAGDKEHKHGCTSIGEWKVYLK